MIHDILISLLCCDRDALPIADFLVCNKNIKKIYQRTYALIILNLTILFIDIRNVGYIFTSC